MTDEPWWFWLIAIPVVLGYITREFVVWRRRRAIRDRFVEFVRERQPDMEIIGATDDALVVRTKALGEATIDLRRIRSAVQADEARTPEEQARIFEHFLGAAMELESAAEEPLSLETCGDRLMPLLVQRGFHTDFPERLKPPYRQVESLGLDLAYVVDGEFSVRYVTLRDMEKLGLTEEELHERCMDNLRGRFPRAVLRQALAQPSLATFKVRDGCDATRVLLVPEYLELEEEIAALIPDRDTLTLMGLDTDRKDLEELARIPDSDRLLLDRPVKVTREGFEVM